MKLYVSIQTQCGYCDGKGFVESTTRVACGYCNGIGRHTVPVEMSKLAEFIAPHLESEHPMNVPPFDTDGWGRLANRIPIVAKTPGRGAWEKGDDKGAPRFKPKEGFPTEVYIHVILHEKHARTFGEMAMSHTMEAVSNYPVRLCVMKEKAFRNMIPYGAGEESETVDYRDAFHLHINAHDDEKYMKGNVVILLSEIELENQKFIQNLFRLRIRSALQIMEEIYWKEWKS